MINPVSLPVYIATGIGGTTPFVTPAPTVTAHPTVVGVLAMVTNDAFADLVTLNWDDDELQVYINTSGSLSATPMTVPISPPGMGPSGVSVMDIDGVGGPELAITHGGAASDVSIMTSTTSGDISAYTFVPVEGGQSSPTLVDLDGGGYVDLVVSVTLPGDMNQITVACGNETGFDAPQVIADDPSLGKYVIVEDIDGDGARDIAARTMGGFALILASP